MKAERNWALIRSGETFETLATTIVFFKDSNAALFGRRGRDGGQDARSGDGRTVYQAKHHESPTAAKAIADAMSEAANIAIYRQPGHSRHAQWLPVRNWVLVTNASFNPTDDARWQAEVVPRYNALGLAAAYWEQVTIDGYLATYPEIARVFFENESRVFLSPPEARLRVAQDEPFSSRAELGPYVGREPELAQLESFLDGDKHFLQVHAAGGIGKTRFLLEAACEVAQKGEWQVLWANVHSLAASSKWFEGVVPERRTLLIVDEPDDDGLVHRLREQLGGRAQRWKVALAVRSAKDPVLQALQHPRMKSLVQELVLQPLDQQTSEAAALGLLNTGKLANTTEKWRRDTAKILAHRFDGYPIWLTLAVHLLESEQSLATLPDTAAELCRRYLGELQLESKDRGHLLEVARWVALLGPLNREEDARLEWLAERTALTGATEIRAALKQLVAARLLRTWGARNRLVDVKPDVLRDFFLREWFCEERDFGESRFVPSAAATAFINTVVAPLIEGTARSIEDRILSALARTEFLLRHSGSAVKLAAPLFDALNEALPKMGAWQRFSLVETLAKIAVYYPEEVLLLLRRMRLEPTSEEVLEAWGMKSRLTQEHVLLSLPNAIHCLARGPLTRDMRVAVLKDLYALVDEEHRIAATRKRGLPNDGRRADGIIRSLLQGGPGYVCEFGDAAARVVLGALETLAAGELSRAGLIALRAVAKPLCAIERNQIWSDREFIRMNKQLMSAGHPNMQGRTEVLRKMQELLENPRETLHDTGKVALWELLSDAHRSVNIARGQLSASDEQAEELSRLMLEDLRWVGSVIASRDVSPQELRAACDLWNPHAEFGSGPIKELALEFERIYLSNSVVKNFEELTNWSDFEVAERRVMAKAKELAEGGESEIGRFLSSAEAFFGEEDVRRVFAVASSLGAVAHEYEAVRRFFDSELRDAQRGTPRWEFALNGVRSWVFVQRRQDVARVCTLVAGRLEQWTPQKRVDLFDVLYGAQTVRGDSLLDSADECRLIRAHRTDFVDAAAWNTFIACSVWGLRHDWPELKNGLESIFASTPREELSSATCVLVECLQQALETDGDRVPPSDLLQWLWSRVVDTPDLNWVEESKAFYIEKILNVLGKVPATWLVDAVQVRARMREGELIDGPSKLIPMVETFAEGAAGDPSNLNTVDAVLEFIRQPSAVAHDLPELFVKLDPLGLVVPARVVATLVKQRDVGEVRRLSQVACHYGLGTPAWRQIARQALQTTLSFDKGDREIVYDALTDTGRRFSVSDPREVPTLYTAAVSEAARGLAEEREESFHPLWQQRLRIAELELKQQQERLVEQEWS